MPSALSVCSVAYTEYERDGRVRRMCEALAADGHAVTSVSLKYSDDDTSAGALNGVQLHRIDMRRHRGAKRGYSSSYLRFGARAALALAKLHTRNRFDVIHVNTMPDFMVFAAAIPRLRGATVLLDFHDMMPELYADKFGPEHERAIAALRLVERVSARFAHHVLAVHELHRERLIENQIPAAKISTIMNVPDEAIFQPRARSAATDDRFLLVYHGTIAARHGVDLAVRAFARAHAQRPFIKFRIVGDGDGASAVAAAIRDEGVADAVEFRNYFVPVHEVPALLTDASAGIIPVRHSEAIEMMLPVKLLEYARLGIPVIARRTRTIAFHFGHDALCYADPTDIESMAQAIVSLVDHPERGAAIASRAAQIVEANSWRVQKKSYTSLLQRLRREARP